MPEDYDESLREIRNQGQKVPIIAFYSIQGGVGKSTLARKFAELITVAPGREGRKPNVLLIDLDVETNGLTYRLAKGLRQNFRTVHEILAERNINVAQAITVTGAVSLASGNPPNRGQLYLMPASPQDAKGVFDTIASIDRNELIRLLFDMIESLVKQYDISCVVIDCAPGANPYAAAAATLSDFPFLIGRNEATTFDQIGSLPEKFREWYPRFQPAKQRVIINAVAVTGLYEKRAEQYSVFDYIPLTGDVIHETEGLSRGGSLRMLFFENYIVDIIKRTLVGYNHLIPEAREVAGQEWIDALNKLKRCEEAPKVRHLQLISRLRWAGIVLVIIGLILIWLPHIADKLPVTLANISVTLANVGILCVLIGIFSAAGGWYAFSEYKKILAVAQEMVFGGPDEIFRKLRKGASHRRELDEMMKLAGTIPDDAKQIPVRTSGDEEN